MIDDITWEIKIKNLIPRIQQIFLKPHHLTVPVPSLRRVLVTVRSIQEKRTEWRCVFIRSTVCVEDLIETGLVWPPRQEAIVEKRNEIRGSGKKSTVISQLKSPRYLDGITSCTSVVLRVYLLELLSVIERIIYGRIFNLQVITPERVVTVFRGVIVVIFQDYITFLSIIFNSTGIRYSRLSDYFKAIWLWKRLGNTDRRLSNKRAFIVNSAPTYNGRWFVVHFTIMLEFIHVWFRIRRFRSMRVSFIVKHERVYVSRDFACCHCVKFMRSSGSRPFDCAGY